MYSIRKKTSRNITTDIIQIVFRKNSTYCMAIVFMLYFIVVKNKRLIFTFCTNYNHISDIILSSIRALFRTSKKWLFILMKISVIIHFWQISHVEPEYYIYRNYYSYVWSYFPVNNSYEISVFIFWQKLISLSFACVLSYFLPSTHLFTIESKNMINGDSVNV